MFADVLIGGIIGDAFGSYYENKPFPCRYVEHDDWRLTDDSVPTLATARSILRSRGFDLQDLADEYVREFKLGRIIGIGASTLKAMVDLQNGMSPLDSGRRGERAAGNGVAMRIAPLCALFNPRDFSDRKEIRAFSDITHSNDEAFCAGLAVMGAINGEDTIDSAIESTCDSNTRDMLLSIRGQDLRIGQMARKIGTSGYAAESVPLAIYGASLGSRIGFNRVIIELCCCGGDADTIASIAGQIMASNGIKPDEAWINRLDDLKTYVEMGKQLDEIKNAHSI